MDAPREQQKIAGYDYGTNKVAKSPISLAEWEELKKIGPLLGRGRDLFASFGRGPEGPSR